MLPQNQKAYLLDTINQLVFDKLDSRFSWAILNSRLMNFYVARFVFSKAQMTMHFDAPATDKIPLPKLTAKNKKIISDIVNLVDKILAITSSSQGESAKSHNDEISTLESKIDDLIYKLYDLDSRDIEIIRGNLWKN